MQRAGAVFSIIQIEGEGWRYRIAIPPEGDHSRYATLFNEAKATPERFARFKIAVWVAIMRTAWQLPERDSKLAQVLSE